jgi:hypothetical protein
MTQPVIDREHPAHIGGTQQIFRFPNGYGRERDSDAVQLRRDGRWKGG